MRLGRIVVIGLALLGRPMAAAQQAGGDDVAAVRRAIEAQNRAWERATIAGDAAVIAQIFADSGVEVSLRSGKLWKGRAAIQELFTERYRAPHATAAAVETDQVLVDGVTAVEYGRFRFTYPPKDGQPQVDSGTYVVVWRKQAGGSWRILMDVGLPAP